MVDFPASYVSFREGKWGETGEVPMIQAIFLEEDSKQKTNSGYSSSCLHHRKLTLEPEHVPLQKEKHLQTTKFLGSMLVFGGVICKYF